MIPRILPPEIFYDVLRRVTPSWTWGWRWKDIRERMIDCADLQWFLNLRLVSKVFDAIVIDLFHEAIRARQIGRDLAIRRGPRTPSTLAMGRRLLMVLVHRHDRASSKYSLINTINRGVEGAVSFLSRSECSGGVPDELQTSYRNGLVSAFVGVMGTDLLISILDGTFGEDADNLDEEKEEWRLAALMAAAYLGRIEDMKLLIASGVDVNSDPDDKWLYPPLMAAAFGGHEEAVRFLIDQGADPNARNAGNDDNAMHFAALGGHASLVQFFLDIGVEPDVVNDDCDTPLLWAAGSGRAEIVPLLLTQDVDINGKDYLARAPLIWAVARGYDAVVKELLESKKLDVNTTDEDADMTDMTALSVAAVMGRENIFQMLFAHPETDIDANMVFHFALIGGRVSIVKTIMDMAPGTLEAYERCYAESALLLAAAEGSEAVVHYLLARDDILINSQNHMGWTALHEATYSGDIGKVKALLDRPDLDVNLTTLVDDDSASALHMAARTEPLDTHIVKALLEHPRIDANSRDLFDRTPLASAAHKRQVEMVKLLLARDDVDRSPVDEFGNTPLLLAAEAGDPSTTGILLAVPSTDIWHRNRDNKNALALAAELGHWKVARRFLDPGLGVTNNIIRDAINNTKNALDAIWKERDAPYYREVRAAKTRNTEVAYKLLSDYLDRMAD